jgi:hypothetical protein
MGSKQIVWSVVLLVMVMVPRSPVQAKGAPSKAVVRGPGLPGPVEIVDPTTLEALSFFVFEQVETNNRHGIDAPAVGEGYEITRYIRQQDTSLVAWDMVHYYPDASGSGGFVFVDGLIGPSSTEFDGKWYPVSPRGDAAMRALLADHGIALSGQTMLPRTGDATGAPLDLVILALAFTWCGRALVCRSAAPDQAQRAR